MYIPRHAKRLFQHNDGWERFLEKNGHQLSDWTKLSVERMLACLRYLRYGRATLLLQFA